MEDDILAMITPFKSDIKLIKNKTGTLCKIWATSRFLCFLLFINVYEGIMKVKDRFYF